MKNEVVEKCVEELNHFYKLSESDVCALTALVDSLLDKGWTPKEVLQSLSRRLNNN